MHIENVDRNAKQGVEFTGNQRQKSFLTVSLKEESVIMTLDTRVTMRAEEVIDKNI